MDKLEEILAPFEDFHREAGYALPTAWALSFFVDHEDVLVEVLKNEYPGLAKQVEQISAEVQAYVESESEDDEAEEDEIDAELDDPRQYDELSVMVCFHNRYSLGDAHPYKTGDYHGWDEMEADIRKREKPLAILPLFLYDHGGLAISTESFVGRAHHGEWDSAQIGFIYAKREAFMADRGAKRATTKLRNQAREYIKAQVEEYDKYLRGEA